MKRKVSFCGVYAGPEYFHDSEEMNEEQAPGAPAPAPGAPAPSPGAPAPAPGAPAPGNPNLMFQGDPNQFLMVYAAPPLNQSDMSLMGIPDNPEIQALRAKYEQGEHSGNPEEKATVNPDGSWECKCGNHVTGRFCNECGAKKPE